jgi:hypothetical protein
MTFSHEVDVEISELLYEDQEYLKLNPEERIVVLNRLNSMLHHTLYDNSLGDTI